MKGSKTWCGYKLDISTVVKTLKSGRAIVPALSMKYDWEVNDEFKG